MDDAELAKRLLMGEKIINVEDLPVGIVRTMNIQKTPHYQYLDPFSNDFSTRDDPGEHCIEIEMTIVFRGKMKDLSHVYKYFHAPSHDSARISVIPREKSS